MKIGQQLLVANQTGQDWVVGMDKTVGCLGIVKDINQISLTVLLKFYFDENQTSEEWWFPVSVLQNPERSLRALYPEILCQTTPDLTESCIETEQKLSYHYLADCALRLLQHQHFVELLDPKNIVTTTNIRSSSSSSSSRLSRLLFTISRKFLHTPIPDLSMNPCRSPFLEQLRLSLFSACNQNRNTLPDLLFSEACDLLQYVSSLKGNIVSLESEHPLTSNLSNKASNLSSSGTISNSQSSSDEIRLVKIEGASALFVTFDRRSELPKSDLLDFFSDEDCTTLVARANSVGTVSFAPLVVSGDSVWVQHNRSGDRSALKSSSNKDNNQWGYKMVVIGSYAEFNMALWLLEFLMTIDHEETETTSTSTTSFADNIKDFYPRTFKAVFAYLSNASISPMLKVFVLKLLTRLLRRLGPALHLKDIRSSDPLQITEHLRSQMDKLLQSSGDKWQLCAPYVQNLVELMTELHRVVERSAAENDSKAKSQEKQEHPYSNSTFESVWNLSRWLSYFQSPNAFDIGSSPVSTDTIDAMLTRQASEQAFLKLNQQLTLEQCTEALTEIFNRLDTDHDKHWNRDEFNTFQTACGLTSYTETSFKEFVSTYDHSNKGITLRGFLDLCAKDFLTSDKRTICQKLRSFGFDPCLHNHAATSTTTSTTTTSKKSSKSEKTNINTNTDTTMNSVSPWTPQMDLQLLAFINQLWEANAIDTITLTPSCICIPNTKQASEMWPLLSSRSLTEVRARFALLCSFNQCVSDSFPLIDLTDTFDSLSVASKLIHLRHLIFFDNKFEILQRILKRTAVEQESTTIYLSRLTARAQSMNEEFLAPSGGSPTPFTANVGSSLFLQAMSQV